MHRLLVGRHRNRKAGISQQERNDLFLDCLGHLHRKHLPCARPGHLAPVKGAKFV
jgi:hypothetical protein